MSNDTTVPCHTIQQYHVNRNNSTVSNDTTIPCHTTQRYHVNRHNVTMSIDTIVPCQSTKQYHINRHNSTMSTDTTVPCQQTQRCKNIVIHPKVELHTWHVVRIEVLTAVLLKIHSSDMLRTVVG